MKNKLFLIVGVWGDQSRLMSIVGVTQKVRSSFFDVWMGLWMLVGLSKTYVDFRTRHFSRYRPVATRWLLSRL